VSERMSRWGSSIGSIIAPNFLWLLHGKEKQTFESLVHGTMPIICNLSVPIFVTHF
jgi:hypothetical protein